MWNEFLPISMPITAISLLNFSDMACSFVFDAPCQLCLLEGREHGRTIPFSEVAWASQQWDKECRALTAFSAE